MKEHSYKYFILFNEREMLLGQSDQNTLYIIDHLEFYPHGHELDPYRPTVLRGRPSASPGTVGYNMVKLAYFMAMSIYDAKHPRSTLPGSSSGQQMPVAVSSNFGQQHSTPSLSSGIPSTSIRQMPYEFYHPSNSNPSHRKRRSIMPFIIHMWLFDAKKPDILHTTNPRPRSAKSRCKKGDLRIDKKINVGLYTTVCNAMLDGYQTIVKLADDRFSEVIEQEYDVYCKLSNLQGTILPRCYGLYKNSEITCLILEHCGRPISSFASLTKMQR